MRWTHERTSENRLLFDKIKNTESYLQFTSQTISFLNDSSLKPKGRSLRFEWVFCVFIQVDSVQIAFTCPFMFLIVPNRWCGNITVWLSLAIIQYLFKMATFTKHRVEYILHALEGMENTYIVIWKKQRRMANG